MLMDGTLFDLRDRRALVTGSSRGLGQVIAGGLGRAGAEVVLNGRDAERLASAVASLREQGIAAHGVSFDVTDAEAAKGAVGRIEDELGPVDILVNNAGIQRRAPLRELDVEDWECVIRGDLTSAFIVGRAVAAHMLDRKAGKIINICSLMSELARPTIAAYAAAKGGLKMLTRAMATEWGPHNVQVNGIGPGYFETDMTRGLAQDEAFSTWLSERTPAGRWGQPEELVGPAVFLASNASSYVNGHILYVDGGLLACI
jgi:gluconate 5-dehydrogenase